VPDADGGAVEAAGGGLLRPILVLVLDSRFGVRERDPDRFTGPGPDMNVDDPLSSSLESLPARGAVESRLNR
jgi:hypothetical protein